MGKRCLECKKLLKRKSNQIKKKGQEDKIHHNNKIRKSDDKMNKDQNNEEERLKKNRTIKKFRRIKRNLKDSDRIIRSDFFSYSDYLDNVLKNKQALLIQLSEKYKLKPRDDLVEEAENNLFKKVIEENHFFLDNTEFIKEIVEYPFYRIPLTKVMPPKTGKSFNIHMLKTFLEMEFDDFGNIVKPEDNSNAKFFRNNGKPLTIFNAKIRKIEGLKLINCDTADYFGRSPVIFFDFKNLKTNNFKDFRFSLQKLVRDELKKYKRINENESNLVRKLCFNLYCGHDVNQQNREFDDIFYGLNFLKNYLIGLSKGEKVWILVDNIDFPYLEAFINHVKDYELKKEYYGEFKKESCYLKIMDLLNRFLNNIHELSFRENVFMTGAFSFLPYLKSSICPYFIDKWKKGYLNKYYCVPLDVAKNSLRDKLVNLNLDEDSKNTICEKLLNCCINRFETIPNDHNCKGFFFADFLDIYNNIDKNSLTPNNCWFNEEEIIFKIVGIALEYNKSIFRQLIFDCIHEKRIEEAENLIYHFSLTDLLEGKTKSLFTFLLMGGLIKITNDQKVKIINPNVKRRFVELYVSIYN